MKPSFVAETHQERTAPSTPSQTGKNTYHSSHRRGLGTLNTPTSVLTIQEGDQKKNLIY